MIHLAQANHASVKCLCPEQITDNRNGNHEFAISKSRIAEMEITDNRNGNHESVRAITKNTTKRTTKETTKISAEETTKKESDPSPTNVA